MTVTPARWNSRAPQVDAAGAGCAEPGWLRVCPVERLTPGRGAAALVGGTQVAIFRLGSGEVFAIDDRDPFSGADVLSRGLVGDADGEPTVASPVYKQRFALRSGRCLDDPAVGVRTWTARTRDGHVEVAAP
jgi:nitrite reductase (NADH) small subunit